MTLKYIKLFEDFKDFEDNEPEKDSIEMTDKFKNRLKELKEPVDQKIKTGDKIILVDKNKGNLSDEIFNFLNENDVFKIKRINSKGKLDLGFFRYYTRKDGKKIKKVFYFSPRRFKKIEEFNKISQLFLSLNDIDKNILVENPLDFFDVDDKGNITFLPRRDLKSVTDPFDTPRRQTTRLGRMLKRIFKKDYLDNKINQRDIEIFTNKWNALFDDNYKVEILEGDDILKAYDCDEMGGNWAGSSCANFTRDTISNFNIYKFYTENTENIKCAVVYHKGKIYGRRMMFIGIQSKTHGNLEKGTKQILLNNFYGQGGMDSKIDQLLKRWSTDNNALLIEKIRQHGNGDIFRIKVEKTCYRKYPPIDAIYVNFKTDEIASRRPIDEKNWVEAYSAECRK